MKVLFSKWNKSHMILPTVKIIVMSILLLLISTELFSGESGARAALSFSGYLSKRLQEKRFDEILYRKVWNYLSNPSKGYQKAGIDSEELSRIVREYIDDNCINRVVESVMEALSIDTLETDALEDKSENIKRYIQHIQALADRYGLEVTNIQNRFLVITMGGDPPPLGLVGKIKISSNFINFVKPEIREGVIYATGVNSSKTAVDLAIISMGIIKAVSLKPSNRIHLFVDLSLLKRGNNVDILYNSFELAPINLILDSYFPFVNAEYGYASILLVQSIEGPSFNTPISKIAYNGLEYSAPDTALLCLYKKKANKAAIERKVSSFRQKYSRINIGLVEDVDLCIRFASKISSKGVSQNMLDLLVLFLTENRDLYDNKVKLFEFLKRYVVFSPSGKSLGINRSHPVLKNTEVTLKGIKMGKGSYSGDIYIRFPFGIDSSQIVERVNRSVEIFNRKENVSLEAYINAYNPITMDPRSQLTTRLKRAYQEVTGGSPKPRIADGLYTKLFPNPIGFGPHFGVQDRVDIQREEHISQEELLKTLKIYTTALIYLMERHDYE